MKLITCGSGSSGNSFILESSSEILLLEAGIRVREVSKHINPSKCVKGLIISHVHLDHFKFAVDYSKRFGIEIYGNQDVVTKAEGNYPNNVMTEGNTYNIGGFRVTPFAVYHDVPCFGYLIYHKEMGTLLFASDTFALPYIFKNVNHWLFEANYDDNILEDNLYNGVIDKKQYQRIQLSHMSLANTIKALSDCDAHNAQTITLIHLSSRNSDAEHFKNTVKACFGVPTYIARRSLEVDLTKR